MATCAVALALVQALDLAGALGLAGAQTVSATPRAPDKSKAPTKAKAIWVHLRVGNKQLVSHSAEPWHRTG